MQPQLPTLVAGHPLARGFRRLAAAAASVTTNVSLHCFARSGHGTENSERSEHGKPGGEVRELSASLIEKLGMAAKFPSRRVTQ